MRKFTIWFLIFLAGWMLSRLTYQYLDSDQSAPAEVVVSNPFVSDNPGSSQTVTQKVLPDVIQMNDLLQHNKFEDAVLRFESLQEDSNETATSNARMQILSYARQLVAAQRYSQAEELLQSFLLAAYRDNDARVLLAEVNYGQENFTAAIDQLYQARGFADDPRKLQTVNNQIRSMVLDITQVLESSGHHNALLTLYQQLAQHEPEYAPWFIGLANAQLMLDDYEAARRSLLLVEPDAGVGAKARAMLAEISAVLSEEYNAGKQAAVTEVVGIPLYRHGNHFIVKARQGHNSNMLLLIDTGASMTILRPGVFEQTGIHYTDTGRSAVFNTANGQVGAPVYTLEYLSVGNWQVNQLDVGVLELSDNSNIDGLLGMNFLTHFQFFIDQSESVLRLSVN